MMGLFEYNQALSISLAGDSDSSQKVFEFFIKRLMMNKGGRQGALSVE